MMLQDYRSRIDEVDKELITLIAKRNDLVKQFAIYRKHQQMPLFDIKRCRELLRARTILAHELNIDMPYFKKIYQTILRMSLQIERDIA